MSPPPHLDPDSDARGPRNGQLIGGWEGDEGSELGERQLRWLEVARSTILAALSFTVFTAAGFAASVWMRANSPQNDACIGCPLIVIAGVVMGAILAVAIILQARK